MNNQDTITDLTLLMTELQIQAFFSNDEKEKSDLDFKCSALKHAIEEITILKDVGNTR